MRYWVIVIAGLLCSLAGCGSPLLGGGGKNLETRYYFTGGAPFDFSTSGGADQAVQHLIAAALGSVRMSTGLSRRCGADSWDEYQLSNSGTLIYSNYSYVFEDGCPGTMDCGNAALQYHFAKDWIATEPAADNYVICFDVDLSCRCNLEKAQRLVDEVRFPKWRDNTSTSTVEAVWTVTGTHDGQAFSLTCKQLLTGISYTDDLNYVSPLCSSSIL
jgi:hypothetical protein